jgi:hypothetical protein
MSVIYPAFILGFLIEEIGDEKLFQGNSDIMIDSCTYIYIYTISVRDITLVFANKFCGFCGQKQTLIALTFADVRYISCFYIGISD